MQRIYIMNNDFENIIYRNLNHLQIGKFGEYWVKMWLSLADFDTYTSEVDNKGIDFIIRLDNEKHIDIQVKTIRENGYVFITKKTWKSTLRSNLYLALVILNDNKIPNLYLIPSTVWEKPNHLFKNKDYEKEGQKSLPEWGINISKKNMQALDEYRVCKMIPKIKNDFF